MCKWWLSVICLCLSTSGFAQVTADDFLPPIQGGPTKVQAPEKVKVTKAGVTASSAQDAINTAVQENTRECSQHEEHGVGVRLVRFPSGLGFVATGMATYPIMDNPVATRVAQRKAYVIAFLDAKKGLAETLGGLSSEGQEMVRRALINVSLPKDEMTNIAEQSEESLKQAVDMLLRGFEIYAVQDDTKEKRVTVSIVTTPKTRRLINRPTAGAVEAADLREGLNQVIREVRAGVVPPIGGRVIVVRGKLAALVGFGSAVVHSSDNDAAQARLNLEAQKIAAMRAKDSLCGLLNGDRTAWEGNVVESHKHEVKEFETLGTADPLSASGPAVKKLDEAKKSFLATLESTEVYASVRRGQLPPGIHTRTWFDPDHTWAYAMSVYISAASDAARDAAHQMNQGDLFPPGTGRSGSGFPDGNSPNVKRPGGTVKPGPTGKVGDDKDK